MDKYGIGRHVRWETEVTEASLGRRDSATWTVRARDRNGATTTLSARAVISAVGQLNRPHLPDIPGRTSSPARRSTPPSGTTPSTSRQARGDDRRRAPADSRSRRRSPTTSTTSPCSSAPRSGCSPTRTTTPKWAPACTGRCGTCRSTAAGTGSCCSGRAATRASRPPRVDPDYPDQQRGRQRDQRDRPDHVHRVDHQPGRRRPGPARQGRARLPGHRQAHAAGQRQLAADADPRRRRPGPHRHRRASSPTRSSPRTARAYDGRRHRLRHRLPGQQAAVADEDRRTRRRRSSASVWGDDRRPTSASPCRASRTSSACTARAPTSRTAAA